MMVHTERDKMMNKALDSWEYHRNRIAKLHDLKDMRSEKEFSKEQIQDMYSLIYSLIWNLDHDEELRALIKNTHFADIIAEYDNRWVKP